MTAGATGAPPGFGAPSGPPPGFGSATGTTDSPPAGFGKPQAAAQDDGMKGYKPFDPTPPDHIIAKYLPKINQVASKYGVPAWAVKAIIGQESGKTTDYRIRESARNASGASGLGQFMPETANVLGIDPFKWDQAIDGIGHYLLDKKRAYPKLDWAGAAAARDVGVQAMDDHLSKGTPLPGETQRYLANMRLAAGAAEQTRQQQVAQAVKAGNQARQLPYMLDHATTAGAPPGFGKNPVIFSGRTGGVTPAAQQAGAADQDPSAQTAHSGLMEIAGHQDLPFILANALMRDNASIPSPKTIAEQMRDPKSHVYQAWHQYMKDPAQAMDEYGAGSPAQDQYMAKYGKGAAKSSAEFSLNHPWLNALQTFGLEQINPMAWGEGAIAGKVIDLVPEAARALGLAERAGGAAQGAAKAVGLGSPLYDLRTRGGVEASQWAKGQISILNAPHMNPYLSKKLPSGNEIEKDVFGNLTPEAQEEVVRLHQGLKPNPAFDAEHAELERRAKALTQDQKSVEAEQQRVGKLPVERQFKKAPYFPMSRSYDFGPQHELEQQLKGEGSPGGGGLTQHKKFINLDEARASGTLDEDFLPASNYRTWRRQRLQAVAFEDTVAHAPSSIRRQVEAHDFDNVAQIPPQGHYQPTLDGIVPNAKGEPDEFEKMNNAFADFNSRLVGAGRDARTSELAKEQGYEPQWGDPRRITPAGTPEWVHAINLMPNPAISPILARSMIAPQFWDYLRNNTGLQRYVSTSGTWLPGQEQTWAGKAVAMFRNAILSNFFYHPTVNVAGNDAAARGVYNLGGPQFGRMGYAYNAAKSLAMQAGLKSPESFIGGAEEYASWIDHAMTQGGIAEFGEPKTSALGGDYSRVMTVPQKTWIGRLDKAMTKFSDFNRERTFGQKGEQAFAVSLFRDAVQKGGMSDAQAGEMVRQALGDYYNFDPKSPWSMFFFFMPWLKGNMKFWINTLVRRPQYVTATPHALRNLGMQTDPENYQGPNPTGDYTVPIGGKPYTLPFVGRDIGHLAEAGRQLASGQPIGAAAPVEQMLAGRATPVVRGALDLTHTIDAYFSPGDKTKGPETDWRMITNPEAPPEKQFQQAAAYFGTHFIPIPLFTYALQDAARRGMGTQDVVQALITAGGGGYFGEAKLDDADKRQLSQAQKQYKRAYDRYRYQNQDLDELRDAWDKYSDRLKDLGVIQ